jgi:uncharacterized protein (UPF0261 family)
VTVQAVPKFVVRFEKQDRIHEIISSGETAIGTASMLGTTTNCVEHARKRLEHAGYEELVFHAIGAGGRAMESLIDAVLVGGVLDVTTTEGAVELVRGILDAEPHRLGAAARRGNPAVFAPRCLEIVNFG